MRIELGSSVRDVVTGFTGVAVTRNEHMTGCVRYWVEGTFDPGTGKWPEFWIDEARLELVEKEATSLADEALPETGPAPADCGHPSSYLRS